jgi:prophage regulatory protein
MGKMAEEILDSKELGQLTGTRASTWRYWASIGQGPAGDRQQIST